MIEAEREPEPARRGPVRSGPGPSFCLSPLHFSQNQSVTGLSAQQETSNLTLTVAPVPEMDVDSTNDAPKRFQVKKVNQNQSSFSSGASLTAHHLSQWNAVALWAWGKSPPARVRSERLS